MVLGNKRGDTVPHPKAQSQSHTHSHNTGNLEVPYRLQDKSLHGGKNLKNLEEQLKHWEKVLYTHRGFLYRRM